MPLAKDAIGQFKTPVFVGGGVGGFQSDGDGVGDGVGDGDGDGVRTGVVVVLSAGARPEHIGMV